MADKFTIKFDAQMEIGQLKTAIGQIQQEFKKIQIPQNATKPLTNTLEQLSKEIENFEKLTSKSVGSKADFGKIEKSSQHLLDLWEKLSKSYEDLTSLSDNKLKKLFPEEVSNNIKKANSALEEYKKQVKSAEDEVKKAIQAQEKLNNEISKENNKKVVDTKAYENLRKEIRSTENELDDYKKKLEEVNNFIAEKEKTLKEPKKSQYYRDAVKEAEELNQKILETQTNLNNLLNNQANTTTNEKHSQALNDLNQKYQEASQKVQELTIQLQNLKSTDSGSAFDKLAQQLKDLLGIDLKDVTQDAEGLGKAIEQYITNKLNSMRQSTEGVKGPLQNLGNTVDQTEDKVKKLGITINETDLKMQNVQAIKSRVTAFFGLNNTIQLVQRSLRSAFNTVKDLDKAMTETAVVTNFNVGDMWSQLPEYTARANALGVTTLEAYQASTLFYQQGLKTNEVVALSNETLKMARIAGLEAAEATDRMTNALRGFNMTISETNAQRVDDVYSKLAAISASNVDEISTAMTKVASLAHNANMEFETTAAFLAQIIETTRESAETAGTALKTVVARFSEVKDLYTKNELIGTDEEGETIDVNKIGKALRTAGIDLNRYFIGEVGLDDIFMELAEKWDNLTGLQQRYIATQAAGSRQQSRFIALMSDYARTQELVGAAYNANGAAAQQFEKTQESLQSKLARLKNAWDEFTMGLANSTLIKVGVDLLTSVLNVVNKLTSGFGLLSGSVGSFVSGLLRIGLIVGGKNLLRRPITGLLGGIGQALGVAVTQQGGESVGETVQAKGLVAAIKQSGGLKSYVKSGAKTALAGVKTVGSSIISAAPMAVAAAAVITAVYGEIKQVYDNSYKGQLEYTEKVNNLIKTNHEKYVELNNDLKNVIDVYKQSQEDLSYTVKGTDEWCEATQKVNDALLDIQKKYPEIQGIISDGQGSFIADLAILEEQQKVIEKREKLYSGWAQISEGGVAQAKAKTVGKQEAKLLEASAQQNYYNGLKAAYGDTYSDEAIRRLSQSFDFTKWSKEAAKNATLSDGRYVSSGTGNFLGIGNNFFTSRATLAKEYEKITGVEVDKSWSKNQISEALGEFQHLGEIEATLNKIETYIASFEIEEQQSPGSKKGLLDFLKGDPSNLLGINDKIVTPLGIIGTPDLPVFVAENRRLSESEYDLYSSGKVSDNVSQAFEDYAYRIANTYGLTIEQLIESTGFENAFEVGYNAYILKDEWEKVQEVYQKNVEKTIDDTKKIFEENLGKESGEEINNFFREIFDESLINKEIDFTTYEKIGTIFSDLASEGIDVVSIFQDLTPEAGRLLAQLDLSDPNSIHFVINELGNMGVVIDNEVEEKLIKLADAAGFVAEALGKLDGVLSKADFIKKLDDKKDRTFTQEEYDKYGVYDKSNFVKTGTNSYVYIGESLDNLKEVLLDSLETDKKNVKESLDYVEDEFKLFSWLIKSGELYGGGSNLYNSRPKVTMGEENRAAIESWGMEYSPGNYMTVASQTFQHGDAAIVITPILPNGKVLNQQELEDYFDNYISTGSDSEGLILGTFDEGSWDENLAQSDLFANKLHEIHEKIISIQEENGFVPDISETRLTELEGYVKQIEDLEDVLKSFTSPKNFTLEDKKAINTQFYNNYSKELLKYYTSINNELRKQQEVQGKIPVLISKQLEDEKEREAYTKLITLVYEAQVQELQEVSSAIKENKELLFSDNETEKQNAISAIANEIAKAYGISKEAAYDFVNEHTDIVSKAMETDIGYAEFNKKLSETVFEYLVSQAGKSRQLEGSALESLKEEAQQTYNEILSILDNVPDEQTILIDANLSLLLQKLKEAEINIDDFMASLGYSLVPSIAQARNPAWTSDMSKQEFIASGLGPPYLTTTTYTVKKIGTSDIGGSPGGGSPGGSSSKEPDKILQSDILKEQFEREQEIRNVGEKTEDKGLIQNFIDKAPDWILDIIAELRKEAKLNLGDMRTLEIQEGDTTEILEWLQKYYDAKTEQIPEDTTEKDLRDQISDLEAERDYKEKEGAPDGELAEIDDNIVNLLEQLIAILVEQNNGEYNAEIWNLLSKVTDVQNRGNEELENWLIEIDRYYNLNNLLERLADTGQDLIDTIDDSFNNPDSSGKEIVTNIVKAADVFAEELSAELYKSEALNTDRQNLLNKGSKFAAAGLIRIDDSGIVRQIADNIYNLQNSDKELYEEFQQWTSELNSIDNDIRSNESAIKGTYSKFDSLRSDLQQAQNTYVDLLKRAVDALISVQQDAIDTQKAINDSLNETGRNIIDGMREQIDLERQIRDNTKTEEEIRDMESRLAYLRRDTTGANAQEIMKLEKQIAEKRENYQDKLVDQRLQELQKQQQDAEKARNFQTQAMQERLDEQIKQGAFNNEAARIIENSIDENGNLINDSALVQILKQSENWDALSKEERDIITTALNQQVNGAAAWLMSKEDGGFQSVINDVLGKESPLYEWLSGGDEKSLPALINELLDGLTGFVKDELDQVNSKIESLKEMNESNGQGSNSSDNNSDDASNGFPQETSDRTLDKSDPNNKSDNIDNGLLARIEEKSKQLSGQNLNKYLTTMESSYDWFDRKLLGYAKGGLAVKTGPAWLDGTPSRPEYVLSADQTQAFLRLAEVLPSIMRGNTTNSVDSVKNIYLNLTMNVDEIADDYDVDQIADRVKEILYDVGTYRNVNMLSLN